MNSTNKDEGMQKKALMKIELYGYEAIEKTARKAGSTAGVYVPVSWASKKIKIIRLE